MKKLIFLVLSSLLLPALSFAKPFGDYQGAVYVQNYDGDTVTFNLPGLHPIIGEKINIRVNGIDTPEIRGKKYFIFLVSLIHYGTTPVIHPPLISRELPYSIKKPLFFLQLPQKVF